MYNFDNCTLLTYIIVTKITGFTVLVAKFQVSMGGHYNISDYFFNSKMKHENSPQVWYGLMVSNDREGLLAFCYEVKLIVSILFSFVM